MVLEVMGRHAGWIALHGGIAGGADAILIPEIPFDYEKLADFIKRREAAGSLSSMVVVAEGATPKDGQQVLHQTEAGEYRFGGIGDVVAHELAARTGKETRCCVLGHLQRGGRADHARSHSRDALRREGGADCATKAISVRW